MMKVLVITKTTFADANYCASLIIASAQKFLKQPNWTPLCRRYKRTQNNLCGGIIMVSLQTGLPYIMRDRYKREKSKMQ